MCPNVVLKPETKAKIELMKDPTIPFSDYIDDLYEQNKILKEQLKQNPQSRKPHIDAASEHQNKQIEELIQENNNLRDENNKLSPLKEQNTELSNKINGYSKYIEQIRDELEKRKNDTIKDEDYQQTINELNRAEEQYHDLFTKHKQLEKHTKKLRWKYMVRKHGVIKACQMRNIAKKNRKKQNEKIISDFTSKFSPYPK